MAGKDYFLSDLSAEGVENDAFGKDAYYYSQGVGMFDWAWLECCTAGMVVGPLPAGEGNAFTMNWQHLTKRMAGFPTYEADGQPTGRDANSGVVQGVRIYQWVNNGNFSQFHLTYYDIPMAVAADYRYDATWHVIKQTISFDCGTADIPFGTGEDEQEIASYPLPEWATTAPEVQRAYAAKFDVPLWDVTVLPDIEACVFNIEIKYYANKDETILTKDFDEISNFNAATWTTIFLSSFSFSATAVSIAEHLLPGRMYTNELCAAPTYTSTGFHNHEELFGRTESYVDLRRQLHAYDTPLHPGHSNYTHYWTASRPTGGAYQEHVLAEAPYGGIFLTCLQCETHCAEYTNCGQCSADPQCGWKAETSSSPRGGSCETVVTWTWSSTRRR